MLGPKALKKRAAEVAPQAEGAKAFASGVAKTANPYMFSRFGKFNAWNRGWQRAWMAAQKRKPK